MLAVLISCKSAFGTCDLILFLNAFVIIIVGTSYSHQEFTEIQCIINYMEERKMKEIIKEIDPQAFVTIYEVVDVSGDNFGKKDIH